jgi:CRISPR-associated endonuclease/helicase Cas3
VRVPPRNLATYLSKNGELRAPAGLGSIYADGRVLARTWESLQEDPVLVLPEQARERIEGTTHEEAFANLPEVWGAHGHALYGKVLMQVHQAQRSVLDDRPFGELHYVDKSEDVLTRLGDPTFELPLAAATRSPFGVVVRRVAIPARWLAREKDVPEVVSADLMPDGFRLAIGKTAMQYTRLGLERKDDA